MNKQYEKKVRQWCQDNNWTDLFIHENKFYAFPPNAVIPLPVPIEDNQTSHEYRRGIQLLWLAGLIDIFLCLLLFLRFIMLPKLSLEITLMAIFCCIIELVLIEVYTIWRRKYEFQTLFRYPLVIVSIFFINYQIVWLLLAYH